MQFSQKKTFPHTSTPTRNLGHTRGTLASILGILRFYKYHTAAKEDEYSKHV